MIYIWIFIALFFAAQTAYHTLKLFQNIRPFKNKGEIKNINGLTTGVPEFIEDFNKYLSGINRENRIMNSIATSGAFIAFFTSILSIKLVL